MSMFELTDRIAIVTGGATGIGKGIALDLARAGANVVVASRNRENLEKAAAEIRVLGRESLVVPTDVCIPEQADNLVKQTVDRFGRIDILVNCAGGGLQMAKVQELSLEIWKATIDLNLTGTFLCSIAAGKVMIEQNSGKIINISSIVGVDADPRLADYSVSKAGVINLTMSLAIAWAQHNINVNSIFPGVIATERHHRNFKTQTADGSPLPRLRLPGSPRDVGHLAVFLASEASSFISGEIIGVRGIVRGVIRG